MSASSYDEALARVLTHEGGYTNDADDPGGPTNYGITIGDYRRYVNPNATVADVKTMPLEVAKRIYREKYWNAMQCDMLPAGLDYCVFDYGVNSGIFRSAKVLQGFLGVEVDGAVGPNTLAAASAANAAVLVNKICDERLAFLKGLSNWSVFGRGWGRRVSEVRDAALAMTAAEKKDGPLPKPTPSTNNAPAAVSVGRSWASALLEALFGRKKPVAPVPTPAPAAPAIPAPILGDPPWFKVMVEITGIEETPGPADNPVIMAWPKFIGETFPEMKAYCAEYVHDEIPWCGLTVGYCLAKVGIKPPYNPAVATDSFLWADSYAHSGWGRRLDKPVRGCVMVFTRNGGGHVSLYEGREDDDYYYIRGGNQADMVNVTRMAKNKLTAAMWPK